MYTTTHYGLNIVEGTDVVNPLVQQNPNYTAIDAAMFANKQGSIGSATELKGGTIHTITRANTDSNYIRFTATSNWEAGDSMVVDSTPVSVYMSDGSAPANGAYIINTEVLLILNGSRVTLIASNGVQDAAHVSFDNSGTDLVATNAEAAIKEVNTKANKIRKGTLSVATDASGSWAGTVTIDGYSLTAGELLSAYLERDSYTANRKLDVLMYGSNGYQFVCYNSLGNPIANSDVNITIVYLAE